MSSPTPPPDINETDWSPERKVVGSAVAVLVLWLAQLLTTTFTPVTLDFPPGLEGAIAILVAYFLPNARS